MQLPIKIDARRAQSVVEAGKPFGVRRIGWLSFAAQLPEGGFPQEAYTFYTVSMKDKGLVELLESLGYRTNIWPGHRVFVGSSGIHRALRALGRAGHTPEENPCRRSEVPTP